MQGLLIVILCFFGVYSMDPTLLANLRAEVDRIVTSVPGNAGSFITDINANAWRRDAVTDANGVEGTTRSWGIPEPAVQRFKTAMWAASTAFQSFQITIPARVDDATSYATMDEIIGVARNNGGQIQLAAAWVSVRGRLIGQFDTIAFKKCKKVLFVKSCKKGSTNVPRGFTGDEINLITNALRGTAYSQLKNQANQPKLLVDSVRPFLAVPISGPNVVPLNLWHPAPVDPNFDFIEFPFSEVESLSGSNETEEDTEDFISVDPKGNWTLDQLFPPTPGEIDTVVTSFRGTLPARAFARHALTKDAEGLVKQAISDTIAQKLPELQSAVQSSQSSEIIQRLSGRGFTSFKQSTNIQQVNGVMHQYLDMFLDNIVGQLAVPPSLANDIKDILRVIEFADTNTWFFFRAIFSMQRGAAVKHISVLSRHNQADDSFDFFIADIQASFDLAPDVLIIRESKSYLGGTFGSSTQRIKLIPRGIRQEDLEAIFAFFDIVTYQRFAEILHIIGKRSITSTASVSGVQDFGSAVSSITGSFTSIVGAIQALKSSTNSEIVNQFMGPSNGFSNLVQRCQVQRLTGMLPDYLPAFSDRLLQRLKIPAHRKDDFANTLADIPFFESQQVMGYDLLFDINNGGDCKYVSLLVERRPDDKIDWLIADFQANFKLAPNVFVVRKAKSIAGVWSSSSDKLKSVPRGITDQDLEFVFKWMQLISFKRFADLLGLAVPNPQGV